MDYTFRYTKAKRSLAEVDEIIKIMGKRIEKKQQILHRLVSKQQTYTSIQEEEQTKWSSFIETSVRKHAADGRKQFSSLVRANIMIKYQYCYSLFIHYLFILNHSQIFIFHAKDTRD